MPKTNFAEREKPIHRIDVGTYFRLSLFSECEAKGGSAMVSKQNLLTFQICVVHTTCDVHSARGEERGGGADQPFRIIEM